MMKSGKILGLTKNVKKKNTFLQKLKDAESRNAMTRARSDYKKTIHKARYESDMLKHFVFNKLNLLMSHCIGKC